jgi:Flp pilus assembly protein TadD
MRRGMALLLLTALGGGCASLEGARLYRSGTEALEVGDTARAVSDRERAATLVPQASEIQNHLGIAYLAAGRREDARAAFERSSALDCDNPAPKANLRLLDEPADL